MCQSLRLRLRLRRHLCSAQRIEHLVTCVGSILWSMWTGQVPWANFSESQIMVAASCGRGLAIPSHAPSDYQVPRLALSARPLVSSPAGVAFVATSQLFSARDGLWVMLHSGSCNGWPVAGRHACAAPVHAQHAQPHLLTCQKAPDVPDSDAEMRCTSQPAVLPRL